MANFNENGVGPRGRVRDFRDVLSIVFFATLHAHGSWPKKKEFDIEKIQPPFAASMKIPMGGFAAMTTAGMKLNRVLVAEISCPDRSEIITPVQLEAENIVEYKFEGPAVGSMEVTIRGVSQAIP